MPDLNLFNQRNFFKLNSLILLLILLFSITACNDSEDKSGEASIDYFVFQPELNNGLDEAIIGKITDFNINLSVPYKVSLNQLVATFNYVGVKVEVKNTEQVSGVTANDYSNPVIINVIAANGESTQYTVTVTKNKPRIPQVYINTEGNFEFEDEDKENYVNSTIRIEDLDNYYTTDTEFKSEGEIKGRGNSTWWGVAKKPYRIRLEKKNSLLGMSNDRNWALLANHFDKTLLRNITAFEISRIAEMRWTPQSVSVDYYMNGTYRGVYTLTEHVRVSDERLNLDLVSSDDNSGEALTGDYFLELDFHYDEPYKFKTQQKGLPIMFKDPDVPTSNQFDYVQNFFNTAESVLYSENFKDAAEGYRKYIDVESFINYYIVHELTKNVDGNFRGSCHMALRKNGKIELPMVWDFDLAFGNADYIIEEQGATSSDWDGWYIKTQSPWFDQLFKDPTCVAELKARWNELKPQLLTVPDFIRSHADELNEAQARNFSPKPQGAGWSITHIEWNTSKIRGSYQNEVNYLVSFVEKRIQWLDENINKL